MLKQLSVALVSGVLSVIGFASNVSAEPVLAKVARTGVLTVGVNFDRIPYSYSEADNSPPVGFSIDIANLVKDTVEDYLGEEITIGYVEAETFGDRLNLMNNKQIDLSCDVVFTWHRDQLVDFSDSYSVSGIRLMALADSSLDENSTLANAKIGVISGPLLENIVKAFYPEASVVTFENYDSAFDALEDGNLDALAGDSVLLGGFSQPRGPENYKLVPELPITNFGISCMVPQNNSAFLNLVNYSIARFMEGYITDDPDAVAIIDRWFGDEGTVPLGERKLNLLEAFYAFQLFNRAQVPPEGLDFNSLNQ